MALEHTHTHTHTLQWYVFRFFIVENLLSTKAMVTKSTIEVKFKDFGGEGQGSAHLYPSLAYPTDSLNIY